MRTKSFIGIAAVLLLAVVPALAAPAMLNAKLVKLTGNGGVTPGLEDVAAIIRRNLPYAGCELVEQKACVMPANATLAFKSGYSLVCRSEGEAMTLTILRKNKMLLSTAVTLKDATPVIIGGFDGGPKGAKHVFVLQKSE